LIGEYGVASSASIDSGVWLSTGIETLCSARGLPGVLILNVPGIVKARLRLVDLLDLGRPYENDREGELGEGLWFLSKGVVTFPDRTQAMHRIFVPRKA
jgi:hypothetical protein